MGIAMALADRLRLPPIFGHELWRAQRGEREFLRPVPRRARSIGAYRGGRWHEAWTGRKGEEPSMHMYSPRLSQAPFFHLSTAHGARDSVVPATEEATAALAQARSNCR
jgi:hypothetical protein